MPGQKPHWLIHALLYLQGHLARWTIKPDHRGLGTTVGIFSICYNYERPSKHSNCFLYLNYFPELGEAPFSSRNPEAEAARVTQYHFVSIWTAKKPFTLNKLIKCLLLFRHSLIINFFFFFAKSSFRSQQISFVWCARKWVLICSISVLLHVLACLFMGCKAICLYS